MKDYTTQEFAYCVNNQHIANRYARRIFLHTIQHMPNFIISKQPLIIYMYGLLNPSHNHFDHTLIVYDRHFNSYIAQ